MTETTLAVRARRYKYVALTLIMAVYSLCFVGIKMGLQHSPPLLFGGLRNALGAAVLFGLMPIVRSRAWPHKTPTAWLLLLGLVATSALTGAMFLAGERGSAGLAAALGNVQPIFTLILALLVLGERMTGPKLSTAAFGVIGIVLLGLPTLEAPDSGPAIGATYALASSVILAATNVYVKKVVPIGEVLSATAWMLAFGAAPLILLSLAFEDWSRFSPVPSFVVILLLLGVIGTGLNSFAWFYILKREEAGIASMFYFAVPVIGLLAGWMVFREKVASMQWIGAGVIVLSLFIIATDSGGKPLARAEDVEGVEPSIERSLPRIASTNHPGDKP